MSRVLRVFRLTLLVSACAVSAAKAGQALEADDDLLLSAPEFVPSESAGRWYLRGDVGYALVSGDARFRPSPSDAEARLSEAHFGDVGAVGVGVGYQFRSWLRGDVIAEWQQNRFSGASADFSCGMGSCRTELSGRATTYSLLANAYVDLGTFAGFTPYVGAGAGVSRVEWGRIDAETHCSGGLCGGSAGAAQQAGNGSFRFTWAVSAGVAYDLGDRLKLDFGYRFRQIAGGGMTATARDQGFSQHDFRLGLRFQLN